MAGSGGTAEPVIRALPEAASLRLSAGQLIVDAAAVVKELVENALDAGATSVSVIVDKDLSSIVVKDNGAGLPVEGRDSIGAAHCTSKIRRFEDLYATTSFGFRGEALRLIIEAAEEVEICTRTAAESAGVSFVFRGGRRTSSGRVAAATTGTTVRVSGLFAFLPVRSKEHVRNAPKILQRLYRLLLGYALSRPQLRLTCSKPFLSKQPAASLAQVVRAVFGRAVADQMVEVRYDSAARSGCAPLPRLELSAEDSEGEGGEEEVEAVEAETEGKGGEERGERRGERRNAEEGPEFVVADMGPSSHAEESGERSLSRSQGESMHVRVHGMWPAPEADLSTNGLSRTSVNDRTFLFLNGRAARLPKAERLVTRLFRARNRDSRAASRRYPFAILLIELPAACVDPNLSPDKADFLIRHETALLQHVQAALEASLELRGVLASASVAAPVAQTESLPVNADVALRPSTPPATPDHRRPTDGSSSSPGIPLSLAEGVDGGGGGGGGGGTERQAAGSVMQGPNETRHTPGAQVITLDGSDTESDDQSLSTAAAAALRSAPRLLSLRPAANTPRVRTRRDESGGVFPSPPQKKKKKPRLSAPVSVPTSSPAQAAGSGPSASADVPLSPPDAAHVFFDAARGRKAFVTAFSSGAPMRSGSNVHAHVCGQVLLPTGQVFIASFPPLPESEPPMAGPSAEARRCLSLRLFHPQLAHQTVLFENMVRNLQVASSELDDRVSLEAGAFNQLNASELLELHELMCEADKGVPLAAELRNLMALNGFVVEFRQRAGNAQQRVLELTHVPTDQHVAVGDFAELCRHIIGVRRRFGAISEPCAAAQRSEALLFRPTAIRQVFARESGRLAAERSAPFTDAEAQRLLVRLAERVAHPSLAPHGRAVSVLLEGWAPPSAAAEAKAGASQS